MENNIENQNEVPPVKKSFFSLPGVPGINSRIISVIATCFLAYFYFFLRTASGEAAMGIILYGPLSFLSACHVLFATIFYVLNFSELRSVDKISLFINVVGLIFVFLSLGLFLV